MCSSDLIVIADRQVSDELARFIAKVYGDGPAAHDQFVQQLASNGTSEPKVLAEFKRQMTLVELAKQVVAGVQVSDQDVRAEFDRTKDQWATPERRDIHNIVVSSKGQADQIVAQLNTGANFEQLAQQQSMDSSTKDKGGDLGPVPASMLEAPYGKVAFAAPLNTVFGPVQSQSGFNVGKVVQVVPPAPAVFDQVKDQVRQQLQQDRSMAVWRDYMTKQIKDSHVVYADAYRPADPDAMPSATSSDAAAAQQAPVGPPAPAPPGQAPNTAPPR